MNKHAWRISALAILVLALVGILWANVPGRMTGGGSVFTDSGVRVTHGFEIHCSDPVGTPPPLPNNLEINWPDNRFHLETLDVGLCTDEGLSQAPPNSAPFDTFYGEGTGRLNGVSGYRIHFYFTDDGEPGSGDTATYYIAPPDGPWSPTVLNVENKFLTFGNHQTHKSNNK